MGPDTLSKPLFHSLLFAACKEYQAAANSQAPASIHMTVPLAIEVGVRSQSNYHGEVRSMRQDALPHQTGYCKETAAMSIPLEYLRKLTINSE